ncbi:hypothetical protein ACOSP7_022837 [Xanthoceras sorbifolium]
MLLFWTRRTQSQFPFVTHDRNNDLGIKSIIAIRAIILERVTAPNFSKFSQIFSSSHKFWSWAFQRGIRVLGGWKNRADGDDDGIDADFAAVNEYVNDADYAGDPEHAADAHETAATGVSGHRLEAAVEHPPWEQLMGALQDMSIHFDVKLDSQDQQIADMRSI